jgi:conjugal transfer/entry exclusion protein
MTEKETEYTIIQQLQSLLDNCSKLSIAHVNQLRINDMRTLQDEIKAQWEQIRRLESRMDKASEVFSELKKSVEELKDVDRD